MTSDVWHGLHQTKLSFMQLAVNGANVIELVCTKDGCYEHSI